jgi:glycosyltransferase involved in cell wall biosynthesis
MLRRSSNASLSIVIPIWITRDTDLDHIRELLRSLAGQKNQLFECVFSVGRGKTELENLLKNENILLSKQIVDFGEPGISANLNNAIRYSNGTIIKVMFQDDLFYSNKSLSRIRKSFDDSKDDWLLSATKHIYEDGKIRNKMIPKFDENMFLGINRISSPSVVTFRRQSFLEFSEEFELLMDIEWYLRMFHRYGPPKIDARTSIINRVHANQTQNKLKHTLNAELSLLQMKHKSTFIYNDECFCIQSERSHE